MTETHTYPDAPQMVACARRLCEAAGDTYVGIHAFRRPQGEGEPYAIVEVNTEHGGREMIIANGRATLYHRHNGTRLGSVPCPEFLRPGEEDRSGDPPAAD